MSFESVHNHSIVRNTIERYNMIVNGAKHAEKSILLFDSSFHRKTYLNEDRFNHYIIMKPYNCV